MRNYYRLWILVAGLMPICPAMAQEEEDMDPVTITASLAPEKASRTGRNLVVIRGERFYDLPVHSVDDLLRYVPGIEIQARGPMGSQSDIVLRGGTFQQVLVILDGVRLNDPNTGHFSSYIPIAPAEIERIEVLKGASSAMYGSEAVGGVIHIITRSFAAKRTGNGTQDLKLQAIAGEYNLFAVSAGGYATDGRTSIGGGIQSNNTKGQRQRGSRGYLNNHTASLSASHHINEKAFLSVRGAFDRRDFAAQNFYTTFVSDTATEKVETAWLQLNFSLQQNNHRININGGYKALDDTYKFNSGSIPNSSKSFLTQGLITDEWKLRERTVITSGLQYINKKIRSNDRGFHTVKQAALFAVLNQQFGDRFSFSPALRLDHNERSGWELVPQANLSYRFANLQLRASAGKTIRDADFTERFNNYNKPFVASGRIGNPDLEEERSFSWEAGADYFINRNWKLSGSYFRRRHSQLIDYVNTPYSQMPRQVNLSPTGTYALAKNIGDVTTNGAELDAQFSKQLDRFQKLWVSLGTVWIKSEANNAAPSLYLSSHARFLANFNLHYQYRFLSFGLNGLYKERAGQQAANPAISKVSADYFVCNGRMEASVLKDRLSAFVQVDNLMDRAYTDLLGSVMPGRWFMGGIKITSLK